MDREEHEEYVRNCKDWIARRKARLDQLEKMFESQYPMFPAKVNAKRHEDLEAWKFAVEIHEWELNQIIETYEEEE